MIKGEKERNAIHFLCYLTGGCSLLSYTFLYSFIFLEHLLIFTLEKDDFNTYPKTRQRHLQKGEL
jgi:hypothetical protein